MPDTESEKPMTISIRESFMSLILFIVLFGGFSVVGGFLMGILAAKSFVQVYNDQQPTTKALIFCEEMITAYKGRDSLQVQENEELREVVNRYTKFLADSGTTIQMKKTSAMGGSDGPPIKK